MTALDIYQHLDDVRYLQPQLTIWIINCGRGKKIVIFDTKDSYAREEGCILQRRKVITEGAL